MKVRRSLFSSLFEKYLDHKIRLIIVTDEPPLLFLMVYTLRWYMALVTGGNSGKSLQLTLLEVMNVDNQNHNI